MFEDVKKEDQKVTVGDPSTVEDPFQDIDPAPDSRSAVQSGKLRPVLAERRPDVAAPDASSGPSQTPRSLQHLSELNVRSGRRSRRGIVVAIVFLLVIAGGGLVAAYVFLGQPADISSAPADEPMDDGGAASLTNVPKNTNLTVAPPGTVIPTQALIDADGDGLTDVEEASIGTDPQDVDTDSDGLSDRDEFHVHKTDPRISDSDNDGLPDRDEIFVWITDPNNPDTDRDSYLDGAEVDAGYNPNGPGKLSPGEL